jgi:Zn-dependent protease
MHGRVPFRLAKPVPVDIRNFKKPKRDMAITALAGPMSNFILAAFVFSFTVFYSCRLFEIPFFPLYPASFVQNRGTQHNTRRV